jgi:hypothetical protein
MESVRGYEEEQEEQEQEGQGCNVGHTNVPHFVLPFYSMKLKEELVIYHSFQPFANRAVRRDLACHCVVDGPTDAILSGGWIKVRHLFCSTSACVCGGC